MRGQAAPGQPGRGRLHAAGRGRPEPFRGVGRRERDRVEYDAAVGPGRVLGKGGGGEPERVVVGLDHRYDGGHALLGHYLPGHGRRRVGRGRGHAEHGRAGGCDDPAVDGARRDDRRAGRQGGRGGCQAGGRHWAHVCARPVPRLVRGAKYEPVRGGQEGAHDSPVGQIIPDPGRGERSASGASPACAEPADGGGERGRIGRGGGVGHARRRMPAARPGRGGKDGP